MSFQYSVHPVIIFSLSYCGKINIRVVASMVVTTCMNNILRLTEFVVELALTRIKYARNVDVFLLLFMMSSSTWSTGCFGISKLRPCVISVGGTKQRWSRILHDFVSSQFVVLFDVVLIVVIMSKHWKNRIVFVTIVNSLNLKEINQHLTWKIKMYLYPIIILIIVKKKTTIWRM